MKLHRAWLASMVLLLVGCTAFPIFLSEPQGMTVVNGGLANVQPYIGRYKSVLGVEVGDLLIASCGCGDWRAVIASDNGDIREQFPVRFFSNGEYDPSGPVVVYAADDGSAIDGTVNQSTGMSSGRAQFRSQLLDFQAARQDAHEQVVRMCQYCHIGKDPLFPLPDTHPKRYLTEPDSCLDCHSANGQ